MTLPSKVLAVSVVVALAGCAGPGSRNAPPPPTASKTTPPYKGGGYYKDDGPGRNVPANLDVVPDAEPKKEALHRYANDPYKVFGKQYVPIGENDPYVRKGLASWYGRKFHGQATASGEPYDMYAMTAAHATLPIPSYARVTNPDNGKSVIVRINDRGPFHEDRIIDLSYTAAYKLDLLKGVSAVEVVKIEPDAAPDSFAAAVAEAPPREPVKAAQAALARAPVPEPVPAPAALQPLSGPVPGELYLQLGAYANPAAADELLARLAGGQAGPGAAVRLAENGVVKVRVGPYAGASEADAAAARLELALGIKPYKVRAAAPAPAPVAAPVQATPAHYLQLAALSSAPAADELAERARQSLPSGQPGVVRLESAGLIKVQVGPFASLVLADQAASSLEQALGVRPYRVVR
jgi:rare lipoprotein A